MIIKICYHFITSINRHQRGIGAIDHGAAGI